jgi:hypothetical protein
MEQLVRELGLDRATGRRLVRLCVAVFRAYDLDADGLNDIT